MSHRTEQKWLHCAFCECFLIKHKSFKTDRNPFFQALWCLSIFSSWFSHVKHCNSCVDFFPEGPVISLITFQHAGQPCSLRTCPASSCYSLLHLKTTHSSVFWSSDSRPSVIHVRSRWTLALSSLYLSTNFLSPFPPAGLPRAEETVPSVTWDQ